MLRTNENALFTSQMLRLLPCLFGGVVLASSVAAAQPPTATANAARQAAAAQTTYRVINLGADQILSIPAINAKGQVAYTVGQGGDVYRAWFYDGTAAGDIGTLGGPSASALDVNDAGQVVGSSELAASLQGRAFVWTKRDGMRDLGALFSPGSSGAVAINHRGQVVGSSLAPDRNTHAFRWSAADGMEDVGVFAPGNTSFTTATAIGATGLVAGLGTIADGNLHAFAWTRKTGLLDLGTLGGTFSFPVAVDAEGRVAGYATLPGDLLSHAFVWNRSGGMKDLGTAGGTESFALAMAANGHVAGAFNIGDYQRAFSWTRARGMVDLGTLGGTLSRAVAVNNKGQVAGGATTKRGDFHGFVWTAKEGMVDLNKRLRHAPAGLVVDGAVAISDNGSIVATSNAGLVLLRPDCGCKGTHTVGPIAAADMVEVGVPFDASVGFAGEDTTARYNVFWSFGDGSGVGAGMARAKDGAGSATGRHAYARPGIYTLTANVVDLAGKSTTVSRTIVASDPSRGVVGGSGRFMSPQGANRNKPSEAGKAAFSFFSSSAASSDGGELRFHAGTLSFRSQTLRKVGGEGARGQFEGRGTIDGRGDYQFALDATSGTPGRFDLKIWHTDPATKAVVVDYDNQVAAAGRAGSAVEGKILIQE